jgi:hypothetical protein
MIWISGQHKQAILKEFGNIDIGIAITEDNKKTGRLTASADIVLPNYYGNANPTIEKDPLYILIPDNEITHVWPCGVGAMKYGIAEVHTTGQKICNGVGIYKGTSMLYICLQPVPPEFVSKLEIGSLGM